MTTFNERIAQLLELHGSDVLAEKTGISRTQLYRLKDDGRETTRPNLLKIAAAAEVDLTWLITGENSGSTITIKATSETKEPSYTHEANPSPSSGYSLIPVLNVEAAAGNGSVVSTEEVTDLYAYKRAWLRDELGADPNDLRIIKVRGDSMLGTLNPGELIFVDTRENTVSEDGVYVLRMDDGVMVKHVQRMPGRVLRVSSKNPIYEPFDIRPGEPASNDVSVIGRVVYVVGGRKI